MTRDEALRESVMKDKDKRIAELEQRLAEARAENERKSDLLRSMMAWPRGLELSGPVFSCQSLLYGSRKINDLRQRPDGRSTA